MQLVSQKWRQVNKELCGNDVDLALSLVDVVLALPPTSVENERSFSLMKYIKGNRRTRLSQNRLNGQLRIRLLGLSIRDFQPGPVIDLWRVSSQMLYGLENYLYIILPEILQ